MDAPRASSYFGEFRLDPELNELFRGDSRVRMQEKPLQVLLLLVERAGEMVSRDDLRHRLWAADTYVDFDRNLNTAVKKLRIALGDSADHPRYIETIPRKGYRMIMPVGPEPPSSAQVDPPALVARATPTPDLPAEPPPGAEPPGRWTAWSSLAATALAAVLLGLVATSAGDLRMAEARINPARKCPEAVKVAVLPFQHDGRGAPHNLSAVLNEGVPKRLLNAREAYLRVFSGRSVREYSCGKKDFLTMGKELGVAYVMEGTVRRASGGLRVTAQLFETRNGSLVAAESLDVPSEEAASAEDRVVEMVASTVLRCVAPQRASL